MACPPRCALSFGPYFERWLASWLLATPLAKRMVSRALPPSLGMIHHRPSPRAGKVCHLADPAKRSLVPLLLPPLSFPLHLRRLPQGMFRASVFLPP